MTVRILYFAGLREAVGRGEERVDAVEGESIAALRQRLASRDGNWQALATMKNIKAALNQTMVSPEASVRDGDEVAFFPPVTGG